MWEKSAVLNRGQERILASDLYLTWEDIELLDHSGMEIGAHTQSHPNIGHLPSLAAELEITAGRDLLAKRLKKPIRSFAYPFGSPGSFNDSCKRALQRIGVDIGCAYVNKNDPEPGHDPLQLTRRPVLNMPTAAFAMELTGIPGRTRRYTSSSLS